MAAIVITTQPAGATDIFGAVDTTLNVVPAAEQGTITYQWKVGTKADGSDLADIVSATTDTYIIPTDSAVGTLYYACFLGTDAVLDDTLTDVVAVIVTEGAITITTQPADQSVAGGSDPANMTVVATTTSVEALTYQWYKCNDLNKTGAVAIELGTTDTLTFGTLRPGYSTYYFCRIDTADITTPVDTRVATIFQNGHLPDFPDRITGAFALDYIAQCGAGIQEAFAELQTLREITIADTAVPLRTEELKLFMDAI